MYKKLQQETAILLKEVQCLSEKLPAKEQSSYSTTSCYQAPQPPEIDEDSLFMAAMLPFLEMLDPQKKLDLRVATQKLLYKFIYEGEVMKKMTLAQKRKLEHTLKRGLSAVRIGGSLRNPESTGVSSLLLGCCDEKTFYDSLVPFMKLLSMEKRLLFRVLMSNTLYSEVYGEGSHSNNCGDDIDVPALSSDINFMDENIKYA